MAAYQSLGARDGFQASFLGSVSKFNQTNNHKSNETQLVEKIEQLQLEGRLLLRPTEDESVTIRLDHHGFQVISKGDDVLLRVPLHTLAQLVMYEDGFSKHNLAVKVIVGKDLFSCHIFQCASEAIASQVCQKLQQVFKTILSESTNGV